MKKIKKHFTKHVFFNGGINFLGGIGIGVLLTRSVFDPHPIRNAFIMIGIAVLGYFYSYVSEK